MAAQYVSTLTIAGSDSCGGAGIQADIKTMSALGCYAASVITAVTVQNTMGVSAVHAVPPEIVAGQIRAVMDDIKPRAVKVGMVNDIDTINAIADTLANYDIQHLVVDPVMVATSGARLMQDEAVEVFTKKLLPMASLLTPNVPEAEVLAGIPINDKDSMEKAAHIIHSKGCKALLIKGDTSRDARSTGSTRQWAWSANMKPPTWQHATPTVRDAHFRQPSPHISPWAMP